MSYFSDRETGEVPRTTTELTPSAWRGIAALIQVRLDDGSFGARYPEICTDGAGAYGTNYKLFWEALRADIPALAEDAWVLQRDESPALLVPPSRS